MLAVLPQICDSAQIEEADEASDEDRGRDFVWCFQFRGWVSSQTLASGLEIWLLEVNQPILGYMGYLNHFQL